MSFDALFDDPVPQVAIPIADEAGWSDEEETNSGVVASPSVAAVSDDMGGDLERIAGIADFDARRAAYAQHMRQLLAGEQRQQALEQLLRETKSAGVQNHLQNQTWIDLYLDELVQWDERTADNQSAEHVALLLAVAEQYVSGAKGRTSVRGLVFLGRVLARSGALERAQDVLQRSLEAEKLVGDSDKAVVFVEMARIGVHLQQYQNAELWANKARAKEVREAMSPSLDLAFNVVSAELDFYQRRFIAATQNYYRLDRVEPAIVALVLSALDSKVAEPSMAKARIRMIGKLVADGRATSSPLYHVLDLISKERVLRAADRQLFRSHVPALYTQPLAELGGHSICDQAMFEHNITAVSRIYANIDFDRLAQFLDIAPAQIERIAARMIMEERLGAVIDQLKQTLSFDVAASPVQRWDAHILGSFALLKATSDAINNKQ